MTKTKAEERFPSILFLSILPLIGEVVDDVFLGMSDRRRRMKAPSGESTSGREIMVYEVPFTTWQSKYSGAIFVVAGELLFHKSLLGNLLL